jgi:hypothetical protein
MQVVLTGLLDTLKDNMPCANAEATMCIGTHTLYKKIIIKRIPRKSRPYMLDQLQFTLNWLLLNVYSHPEPEHLELVFSYMERHSEVAAR